MFSGGNCDGADYVVSDGSGSDGICISGHPDLKAKKSSATKAAQFFLFL